jgi:hypothetical protein
VIRFASKLLSTVISVVLLLTVVIRVRSHGQDFLPCGVQANFTNPQVLLNTHSYFSGGWPVIALVAFAVGVVASDVLWFYKNYTEGKIEKKYSLLKFLLSHAFSAGTLLLTAVPYTDDCFHMADADTTTLAFVGSIFSGCFVFFLALLPVFRCMLDSKKNSENDGCCWCLVSSYFLIVVPLLGAAAILGGNALKAYDLYMTAKRGAEAVQSALTMEFFTSLIPFVASFFEMAFDHFGDACAGGGGDTGSWSIPMN